MICRCLSCMCYFAARPFRVSSCGRPIGNPAWPLSVETLKQESEGGMNSHLKSFNEMSTLLGSDPADPEDKFPAQVEYPLCCAADVCCVHSQPWKKELFSKTAKSWEALAKSLGKPGDVPFLDCIMEVTIEWLDGPGRDRIRSTLCFPWWPQGDGLVS